MFLEDCPLCQLIRDEKVLKKGDRCFRINISGRDLVVGSEHQSYGSVDGYSEACRMLFGEDDKKAPANGIVREVTEWAGHWALELQNLQDGAGKSTVGS